MHPITVCILILTSLASSQRSSFVQAQEFDVVLHGGSYQQIGSSCLVSNRFTSSCSCPPSFDASCYDAIVYSDTKADVSNTITYSNSSSRVNSRFCLCDRSAGLSAAAAVFGGAYQLDDDASCRYKNPHTSSCSCPPGFQTTSLRSLVIQLGTSDATIGSHILVCIRPSSSKPVGEITTDSSSFLQNSQPATVRVLNNFHGVYSISTKSPEKCLLTSVLPGLRTSRYLSSIQAESCNCPINACSASFFWLTDELGPYPFNYQRVGVCESSLQLPVSSSTMKNKVMYGYQKWQTTPKDGLGMGYFHWVRDGSGVTPQDSNFAQYANFGLWPDTTEFPPSNLTATALRRPDGSVTSLYSAYLPETVDLHIRWLKYYGLDGMWLQLFFGVVGNPFSVNQLRKSCEAHGRVFGIMWDISGTRSDNLYQLLENDINRFRDVFSSSSYVKHQGKPLVAIWGFGVRGEVNLDTATRCMQLLKSSGFAVLGGVGFSWRTDQLAASGEDFRSLYNSLDIIAPWTVGVYSTPQHYLSFVPAVQSADASYCSGRGIGYVPVVLPGSGWNSQQVHADPSKDLNNTPRLGGVFLQTQVDAVESSSRGQQAFSHVFVAMFDEFDESTAVAKAAESWLDRPVGEFLSLDADGFHVPNDHYLCLASRETYRLQQPLSISFPFNFRGEKTTV